MFVARIFAALDFLVLARTYILMDNKLQLCSVFCIPYAHGRNEKCPSKMGKNEFEMEEKIKKKQK